ncbi:uncharacterized protein NFIA_012690 [Aspergillus fischeri NRRL 181]|uniref:Uncharacterized protein n=1 Tax=Neosartorya fischeri (strain ATCC 1020 / DSM 3700 / CBS 544.65 / FGSC A1164 / JCM 1740 / NRRL 181 / WB 181) TaxID=331117 RepID=A1D2D7_NEOFI|nr:conserved hypothetical protein [Aspergillus fischeri NRRL 181]EAW22580.1 conserved hypothetical protein [Aspergillus fischeri NRRL 181]
MEGMENDDSSAPVTITSEDDRSCVSETPALDCFGVGVPPASPLASPAPRELELDSSLPQASLEEPLSLVSLTDSPLFCQTPQFNTIDVSTSPADSKAPFVRGHRRRSTHVSRRDLEKFRTEVLGIVPDPSLWCEEVGGSPASINPSTLDELNTAFASASMSLNSGSGIPSNNSGSGMFPNYVDNTGNSANLPNASRQSMSPAMPSPSTQVNGAGMPGTNAGIPMNAGHQMDLHHLYEMVLELSEVLKNNRETTKSIVSTAEEIMKRASSEGTTPSLQQVNGEISGRIPSLPLSIEYQKPLTVSTLAARIAELERALAKEKRLVEILKQEQVENTKLIGEYEAAVGTMVEQIRNYCQNNNMNYLAQKRHYNNLLQAERDAHLESRLDRDHWHAQTMKCAEMIRTAYRLRCEEEELPIRIVSGLQNEVRAYRNALGMEPEKPEEEYGWEILKDVPPSVD